MSQLRHSLEIYDDQLMKCSVVLRFNLTEILRTYYITFQLPFQIRRTN